MMPSKYDSGGIILFIGASVSLSPNTHNGKTSKRTAIRLKLWQMILVY
jgi:hypothetical protein